MNDVLSCTLTDCKIACDSVRPPVLCNDHECETTLLCILKQYCIHCNYYKAMYVYLEILWPFCVVLPVAAGEQVWLCSMTSHILV